MMSRVNRVLFTFLGVTLLAAYFGFDRQAAADSNGDQLTQQQSSNSAPEHADSAINRDFGNLPLHFTALRAGPSDDDARFFYSSGNHYGLSLTRGGAALRLVTKDSAAKSRENTGHFVVAQVSLKFSGGDLTQAPVGEDELAGKVSYLIGKDASRWQANNPTFAKVRYRNIYPGVDAVFYGNQRELEYDFVVAPHADPKRIALEFEGAKSILIGKDGNLILKLENGDIAQRRPVAYQLVNGARRSIRVKFVKDGAGRIAFRLGRYDRDRELIIDPVIVFSTFWGGSSTENPTTVRTDSQGNIYLVGSTLSANFPTVNPLQPQIGSTSITDAFVTKLNPSGNSVVYSTYLGGSSDDAALGLSIDQVGNALVVGRTFSANFPTANAMQTQLAGSSDGFVAKLNSTGSALMFSTYLGGSGTDDIAGAKFDSAGRAVFAGRTDSTDFPTVGALQSNLAGTSLFRSVDGGNSWSGSLLAAGVNNVSSISTAASSPNVVFAATNRGIFRSIDGGKSWSQVGQSELPATASKVAVARTSANVVYAILNNTVYKSVNGGDNWTNVQGSNMVAPALSLAIDPTNAERVFVGCFSGFIYRTTNGGANWTDVSITNVFNNVNAVVVDPTNTQNVYAGTSQRIYKSTVGGGSWTQAMTGIPLLQNFADLLIVPATNTIYAAGASNLYKSTDGAVNWSAVSSPGLTSIRSLAQDPMIPANLYAVTAFSFFRSSDAGMTWNVSNDGLAPNSLLAVAGTANSILLGGYTGTDAFVARLNASGSALDFSTYFGGSSADSAVSLDIGGDNLITFAGSTSSPDFPVSNAFQSNIGGGTDGFVTKLNSSASAPIYSTYLGGSSTDSITSLAVGADGAAYVAGATVSTNFPVLNALQQNCASCASFLNDAYLTKINANGSGLVYSTFLGGTSSDTGLSVGVDSQNRVFVGGSTSSANFPILDPVQSTIGGSSDGFVSQVKADGTGFIYSTYFGGTGTDAVTTLAIAPEGNAIIAGQTSSQNLPTVNPMQPTNGGGIDAFLAKIGVAADLRITLSDERDPVMVNNPLVQNLQISNNGPLTATNVVVTKIIPAGITFVSAVPTQGACALNAATLTCQLGNIALNAQVGIRLTVTPTQAGTIVNTATVSGAEPDPAPGNNSAIEQTTISASPSIFGNVTTGGQPASAVGVRLEGLQNATTTTAGDGRYSFNELSLGGNYTVRPVKAGFYFTPRSKSFNSLTSDGTADFVMSACSYSLSAETGTFGAAGGIQSIQVITSDPFCTWTAVSSAPWLTITSGASGTGNGTVQIAVAASSESRTATVMIGGRVFNVSQSGCTVTITPFQQSFPQAGGIGSFEVKTNEGFCQWNAQASNPWITINGASSGSGNGVINYTISATTRPRSGRITIGGRNFAIYQESNYCASLAFSPVTPSGSAGEEVNDITAADLNGDGFMDFVTANSTTQQTGTYSTYLNTNGTLNRNEIPSGIGESFAIVAGDFNQDSTIDFALQGAGRIAVFQNNGAGAITPLTSFSQSGDELSELYADDFNHDGKTDLLVGYRNSVVVYTNNGNGTFTNSSTLSLTGVRTSYSYAFADYNGDGQTDVAVGQDSDFTNSQIRYFFGTNTGTFVLGGTIPVTSYAGTLKAGDLNGDGRPDLVATGINASTVFIHLWNPATNSFNPVTRAFTEPFYGLNFELADMDNDGKTDIVTYHKSSGNRINVLRGNGNGTFRLPLGFASSSYINAMAFGDINGDGRLDLAFGRGYEALFASQLSQCGVSGAAANRATPLDFDGDGRTDLSVLRPSAGQWSVQRSSDSGVFAASFGTATDVLVPADFTGDGKTDVAVFRPSTGTWFVIRSEDGGFFGFPFGTVGDIPSPADYDGDGKADAAVFRAGAWYILRSSDGGVTSVQFGIAGDKPVPADYDGDGKADIAIYRPNGATGGEWWVLKSSGGVYSAAFGNASDKVTVGDYTGDGKADCAFFRPSNATWYILRSEDNLFYGFPFGNSTDTPAPGDYDGDGKTDAAVFRQPNEWYVNKSSGGVMSTAWGAASDLPISGMFVR